MRARKFAFEIYWPLEWISWKRRFVNLRMSLITELIKNTSWFGSWAVINPKLPEAINKIPESNSNLCIAPGVCREWLKNFSPNERSEKSSSWNKCFNFWTHLNLEWASPHVLYQTQILNFNEFFKGQIKSEWIYEIIKFPKYQPKNQNVNVFYCYCKNNLIFYRIPKSRYVLRLQLFGFSNFNLTRIPTVTRSLLARCLRFF